MAAAGSGAGRLGAADAGPAPPSAQSAAAASTAGRMALIRPPYVFPHVFMPEMCHIDAVTSEHFPQRVGRIP
ncbi:hypothetical protein GCM10009827_030080 [Dactylosporangium maewongense]|uniref:Uncharacterized protein n=1 Tax=Dactylosporangium maewongense TaxID=634393 RepID=A0ABN2A9G2_9ACTN